MKECDDRPHEITKTPSETLDVMEVKGMNMPALHGRVVLMKRKIGVYSWTFLFSLCAVAFSSYAKENRRGNPFFKLEHVLLWDMWATVQQDGT